MRRYFDLEEIKEDVRAEAYSRGYLEGYLEGYEKGYLEGFKKGFEQALQKSLQERGKENLKEDYLKRIWKDFEIGLKAGKTLEATKVAIEMLRDGYSSLEVSKYTMLPLNKVESMMIDMQKRLVL